MKNLFVRILVGVLFITLTACGPSNEDIPVTGTGQPELSLKDTNWRLVSYGEPGSETPVLEAAQPTLGFEEGGQVGGVGGCNTFSAQYEVTGGNEIAITNIISTLMACNNPNVMELETTYFDALRSASSFEISGDMLTIWYENGEMQLSFSRITTGIPSGLNN